MRRSYSSTTKKRDKKMDRKTVRSKEDYDLEPVCYCPKCYSL